MHRKLTHSVLFVLVLGLPVPLGACGTAAKPRATAAPGAQPGAGKPPVTVGAKNFTEQLLLGRLYSEALQAKGYKVRLESRIGSTELLDKALLSGRIDGYPEYTGILLTEVAHQTRTPSSAQGVYDAAQAFEHRRGLMLLERTPFNDVDALAVNPGYAAKNRLSQVGDLRRVASVKLAGPPAFRTRFTGLVGIRQTYGVTKAEFKPTSIGLQYRALDSGAVQAAAVSTTAGRLHGGRYTVLDDPKNIFGFQNVAPVFSSQVIVAEGPAFAQTLNAVSARLTVPAMRRMNAAVEIDKRSPAEVARKFLQANGLL